MSRSSTARTSTAANSSRRRLTSLASIALLAGAATFGVAAPALAHDELLGTELVTSASGDALESFQLTFSNSIIEVGTEIIVTGPDGADAKGGDPEIAGPVVTQPLAQDLKPGEYAAAWRVVSSDGHPIEGTFGIVVPESGAADAAISELDPRGEDEHEHSEGDHDHPAGSEHDDHGSAEDADATGAAPAGMPLGGTIAIAVGGVLVVAGGAAAAIVGNRRRAQGMAADVASAEDAASPKDHNDTTSTEGDSK